MKMELWHGASPHFARPEDSSDEKQHFEIELSHGVFAQKSCFGVQRPHKGNNKGREAKTGK